MAVEPVPTVPALGAEPQALVETVQRLAQDRFAARAAR